MITAVRVVGWVLFALAALGVAGYFDVTAYSLTIGIAAFAPYLMLVAIPALVAFLVGRQWIGAAASVAVLLLFAATTVPLYVADTAPRGARELRVMTINLRLGRADPASVVTVVRRHRPDFLMLEELTTSLQAALATAGLDALLPHRSSVPSPGGDGTGLWSRYPVRRTGSLGLSLRSVVVRADVPGLDVDPTVVALHVAGPFPAASMWEHDMDRLPSRLADLPSDAPVIVGGDFNATHSIGAFRALLEDGYADAGSQAGAGLVRTYPSSSPLLGIDHVLTRGAVGTGVATVSVAGTDHLGLFAVVALAS